MGHAELVAVASSTAQHPTGSRPAFTAVQNKVGALLPRIRALARTTEQDRRVSAETFAALRDTGMFKLMQPARFGGYEYGFGEFVEMNRTLGTACGSTAWCGALGMVHQWLLALFADQAQHDVWDTNPDATCAVSYAPSGSLKAVAGGYRVSGRWSWLSNVDNADWIMLGALLPSGTGGAPQAGFILVPKGDYQIIDDWFSVGLQGTGSKSIEIAAETLVPEHRTLTFKDAGSGAAPGTVLNRNLHYRIPFLAAVPLCLATPTLGIVEGALNEFVDWIGARVTRGAVVAGGNRMAEFPQVQSRIAEAAAAIDAAHLLVKRDVQELEDCLARGEPINVAMRIRNRRDHAYCAKMGAQAASALFEAVGGGGLNLESSVQRAWRDTHAIARHISLNWDAVSTMYGQFRFGLEPKGQY